MTPAPRTRLGLLSLVDHFADPVTGRRTSERQRLLEVVEQGVLAEAAGFERFAIGEHHFSRYISPSAHLLLTPLAMRTRAIRLFTAVTLLPLHDPIQLAEQIGVLDLLCDGRLELSFARGVSAAASEVFGITQDRVYQELEQRFARLVEVLRSGWVKQDAVPLVPRSQQRPHPPLWIGSGVHHQSCDLAVRYETPLILPSLFRALDDYRPCVDRYREGLAERGASAKAAVALPTYCWVAKTSQAARLQWKPRLDQYVAYAKDYRGGFGQALDFDSIVAGPAVCGSPQEVVDKLGAINASLGLDLHLLLVDVGGMPFDDVRDAVDLLGAEVLPKLSPSDVVGGRSL